MLNKKKPDSASPQASGGGLFSKANPSQFNIDFGFGQFNQQAYMPPVAPAAPVEYNQPAPQESYHQQTYTDPTYQAAPQNPSPEGWNPNTAGFNPQMTQAPMTPPTEYYAPAPEAPFDPNSMFPPPAEPQGMAQPNVLPANDLMMNGMMMNQTMAPSPMVPQAAPFDPNSLNTAPIQQNMPTDMFTAQQFQQAPQAYAPPAQELMPQEQSIPLANPYMPDPNPIQNQVIDYNQPPAGFPASQQQIIQTGYQPDTMQIQAYAAPSTDFGVPPSTMQNPYEQGLAPVAPPQSAPTWDSPLTATPFPAADPYFNALHTVDDFWSHAGPGFDDGPAEVRPILPQDVTGQFLDHVHEQLYPQDIPGTIQPPPQYSGQIQAQPPLNLDTAPVYPTKPPVTPDFSPSHSSGGFNPTTPTSSPSVMGPGGLPLPPFEADTNLDAVFDQIEQASKIEPSVPSLYDIPQGPAVFAPQTTVPPAATPVPLETVQPQEIQVQDIFSLSQNHSLLFVEAKGTYALMAMANQQYITLKLFQQSPKTPTASQFHVTAGVLYGQQQLYQVRIGLWEGTVSFDGNTFVLTGEGQVSGF
jgi:hypothetical protein